jgi:hypothetical protein
LDDVEDAKNEETLRRDRSNSTDTKFGCSIKIGQFTIFQLESGICEISVMEAKV